MYIYVQSSHTYEYCIYINTCLSSSICNNMARANTSSSSQGGVPLLCVRTYILLLLLLLLLLHTHIDMLINTCLSSSSGSSSIARANTSRSLQGGVPLLWVGKTSFLSKKIRRATLNRERVGQAAQTA